MLSQYIPSCFSSENTSTISDDEILDFFDIQCKSLAKVELQMWRTHFKEKEKLPDSPQSSLIHANPLIFPNIRKMLIHIMVLPVTSCEAERSFSTLRRIKSDLRTTMTNERLNGLALLSVYNATSYIPTTAEAEFLKKKHRLMESMLL